MLNAKGKFDGILVCQNCNQAFQSREQLQSHFQGCSQFIIFCKRCNSHLSNMDHKCIYGNYISSSGPDKVKYLTFQINTLKELLRVHTDLKIDHLFESLEQESKVEPKKKVIYRAIRNVEQIGQKEEEKVKIEGKERKEGEKEQEEVDDFSSTEESPDVGEYIHRMGNIFETLKQSRTYTENLKNLCVTRTKLFGYIGLVEYIQILIDHLKNLESIFSPRFRGKKLKNVISSAFTSLDLRLLKFGEYHESSVTLDSIRKLKLTLSIKNIDIKPFKFGEFQYEIYTYGLALFPLKEYLTIFIPKYKNIVYFPTKPEKNNKNVGENEEKEKSEKEEKGEEEKEEEKEYFSFYTLDRMGNNGAKYWSMQCRLDDFCSQLNPPFLAFCIKLFREIYLSYFKDNEWRENFHEACEVTNQDCLQLLENIYILSCPVSFRELVTTIILENASRIPKNSDKCNFQSDDSLLKKKVKSEKKTDDGIVNSAKRLFDNIETNEKALQVWRALSL